MAALFRLCVVWSRMFAGVASNTGVTVTYLGCDWAMNDHGLRPSYFSVEDYWQVSIDAYWDLRPTDQRAPQIITAFPLFRIQQIGTINTTTN